MNGEITLTLNASAEFTRKGYGAHVENIGGSFDRITKADTTRGVTLPLTSAGMAMATQLVDKFWPSGRHVVHGHVQGSNFRYEVVEGGDMGEKILETVWRMGKADGYTERQADEDTERKSMLDNIGKAEAQAIAADKREADDWRTVALALARR